MPSRRGGGDFGPAPQLALPRLTPTVKWLLIALGVLYVVELIDSRWLGLGYIATYGVLIPVQVLHGQVWRLFTYPLVQLAGADITGLLWPALALYFFGGPLEDLFGTRRFVLFTGVCVVLAGLIGVAYGSFHSVFRTEPIFGIGPLSFAITAAWGTRFPNQRLMFPPVSGRVLVWITIALALLPVLARAPRENPAAPIGAIAVGWGMAKMWDRIDDWLDRLRVQRGRAKRNRVLRAIRGGLDDRGAKPKRPTDKRFLN